MSKLVALCAIIGFPLGFYGAYLLLFQGKMLAGVLITLGGLMVLAVG
jgi:hypothetical protein